MKKLLIAPFAGTLFFASCSEEKEESSLSDPRDSQIESLEVRLEKLQESALAERESFRTQSAANTAMMSQLKDMLVSMREQETPVVQEIAPKPEKEALARKIEVEEEMEQRKELLDGIRKERLLAQGEMHPLIVTERGEVFREVVISEVNDIGISIRHSGGAGRIAFEDLPDSWKERFGYDPVRSARAQERENIAQAKYAMAASRELKEQQERNEKLQRELREAQLALEVARASQPVSSSVTIADTTTGIIPVQRPIIYDNYYDNYYSRPILRVPKLKVPVIGGSGTYCPPTNRPSVPGSPRPGVNPVPGRPSHDESVTRPPITRPPAVSSAPVHRPSSRPSAPSLPSVSRPSISRPPSRVTR